MAFAAQPVLVRAALLLYLGRLQFWTLWCFRAGGSGISGLGGAQDCRDDGFRTFEISAGLVPELLLCLVRYKDLFSNRGNWSSVPA